MHLYSIYLKALWLLGLVDKSKNKDCLLTMRKISYCFLFMLFVFGCGDDEKELKKKISKFREDELNHKDIAYEGGATKTGLYGLLDKVIKTSSRIAITISEKV